jgi:uncharacterized protein YqjF (DUF2071 family)
MKPGIFLTAEWRKLIMANYEVDPSLLSSFLPAHTELDYWDKGCFVSLVGFMFKNVRVRGIKIPFHVHFPEVNLRFYVRYKENDQWKRGVVFIGEIVPKPAISFTANTLFNEKYTTLPMKYSWATEGDILQVGYEWKKNKRWNKLEVTANANPVPLAADGKEEFITEHFWGYSVINKNRTGEYHVEHPRWDTYTVKEYVVDCDFAGLYGNRFGFLGQQIPGSVFLAEGSPIKVFSKKVLSITS